MAKFKDDIRVEEKYNMGGGGNWMNLAEGDNRIKIVSEFAEYGQHYNTIMKRGIVCIGKEKRCEMCNQGDRPRVQFLLWVIDRADSKLKILRIGYQIYKQLRNFSTTKGYEFDIVPDYDILIKRSGKGLDTEYAIIPMRDSTPLTNKEKLQVADETTSLEDIIEKMKKKIKVDVSSEQDSEIPIVEDDINQDEIPF